MGELHRRTAWGDILYCEVAGTRAGRTSDAKVVNSGGRVRPHRVIVPPCKHHVVVSILWHCNIVYLNGRPLLCLIELRTAVKGNPAGG